jgi:hypothetical protein
MQGLDRLRVVEDALAAEPVAAVDVAELEALLGLEILDRAPDLLLAVDAASEKLRRVL